MNLDISQLAQWAGALSAIVGFFALVVQPFTGALKQNDQTMKSLQKTIDDIERKMTQYDHFFRSVDERSKENKDRIDQLQSTIGELQRSRERVKVRLEHLERER